MLERSERGFSITSTRSSMEQNLTCRTDFGLAWAVNPGRDL